MERMEDTLENAQSEQKNLFLIIFQVSAAVAEVLALH